MSAPKRIQLSRAKGWRKPEDAVVVARPTRWGNPFAVGQPVHRSDPVLWPYVSRALGQPVMGEGMRSLDTRALVVSAYRLWMSDAPKLRATVREALADRDLACWCPLDQPCHADVLLEIANGSPS